MPTVKGFEARFCKFGIISFDSQTYINSYDIHVWYRIVRYIGRDRFNVINICSKGKPGVKVPNGVTNNECNNCRITPMVWE